MKNFTKHLPHYLSLLGIFLVGILAFMFFSYDQAFQIATIIAVAVAYVGWGVIHHYLHRDLYWAVVIEYFAIATLGLIIVFSLVFNL